MGGPKEQKFKRVKGPGFGAKMSTGNSLPFNIINIKNQKQDSGKKRMY